MPPIRTVRGTASPPALMRLYRVTTWSTLRSWRLYSWMRLTWMSNSVSGSMTKPCAPARNAASRRLLAALTSRQACWNEGSSAKGSRPRRASRSVIHASPMAPVISSASAGLAWRRKRRWSMPLVLFENRPGNSSAKSRKTCSRTIRECSSETPLTAWLPTTARLAMRSRRSPSSWTSDTRRTFSSSPGAWRRTSSRKRRLISKTISACRGSRFSNISTGQVSSASGMTV